MQWTQWCKRTSQEIFRKKDSKEMLRQYGLLSIDSTQEKGCWRLPAQTALEHVYMCATTQPRTQYRYSAAHMIIGEPFGKLKENKKETRHPTNTYRCLLYSPSSISMVVAVTSSTSSLTFFRLPSCNDIQLKCCGFTFE